MSHITIATDAELLHYVDQLKQSAWIGFDTEFVSEGRYRPLLCLVQVATEQGLAIIDPLSIDDMTPFWEAIVAPGHQTIVHAGRGEMEFCIRAVGRQPTDLFDMQMVAGLIGLEYPAGFSNIVQRVLGQSLSKAETRTDWRRRPLSSRQIRYALDDVRYLEPIRAQMQAVIDQLDRGSWVREEIQTWQQEIEQAITTEQWHRVSGNTGLTRRQLAVLREIWRWRESIAESRDMPIRRVLRDDLMVELTRRGSADLKQIQAVRGMDRGDLKRALPHLAEAIQCGLDLPEKECPSNRPGSFPPQYTVLGQFMFAALTSICRQQHVASSLVGTSSDVRELIAYHTGHLPKGIEPRLARGWRAEVVGRLFEEMLTGKVAIRVNDPTSDHPLELFPTEPENGATSHQVGKRAPKKPLRKKAAAPRSRRKGVKKTKP